MQTNWYQNIWFSFYGSWLFYTNIWKVHNVWLTVLVSHSWTKFGGILESVYPSVHVSHLCPDDIFRTTEPYTTKLGMIIHHHDPVECHAKQLSSYLQGQGHSAGSNPQKIMVSSISPELFNLATKFGIIKVHHHTLECYVTILDCYLQGQVTMLAETLKI